jgi:hypothetical protein
VYNPGDECSPVRCIDKTREDSKWHRDPKLEVVERSEVGMGNYCRRSELILASVSLPPLLTWASRLIDRPHSELACLKHVSDI